MLENFGVFRREDKMQTQLEVIDTLRERYDRGVHVEDQGNVFNSDLTQAIELGFCLDLAACMVQAGIARNESRGAHSRPYDYPTVTTSTSSGTRSAAGTATATRRCSATSPSA